MRLSRLGRALYALVALGNLLVTVRCAMFGDSIGAALTSVMVGIFAVPAIRGRDTLVSSREVWPWIGRWLHAPGQAADERST